MTGVEDDKREDRGKKEGGRAMKTYDEERNGRSEIS